MELQYHELLCTCVKMQINVSNHMSVNVEKETRKQYMWFKYRAGRVTASRMKSVCQSDVANPSQRRIKTICYPEAFGFKSSATCWGCTHENLAIKKYVKQMALVFT